MSLEPGDLVLTVPHIWFAKCFAEYQAVDAAHMLKMPAGAPIEHVLMTQQLGTVIFATRAIAGVTWRVRLAQFLGRAARDCFGTSY